MLALLVLLALLALLAVLVQKQSVGEVVDPYSVYDLEKGNIEQVSVFWTQFTCFSSTKVQILTHPEGLQFKLKWTADSKGPPPAAKQAAVIPLAYTRLNTGDV